MLASFFSPRGCSLVTLLQIICLFACQTTDQTLHLHESGRRGYIQEIIFENNNLTSLHKMKKQRWESKQRLNFTQLLQFMWEQLWLHLYPFVWFILHLRPFVPSIWACTDSLYKHILAFRGWGLVVKKNSRVSQEEQVEHRVVLAEVDQRPAENPATHGQQAEPSCNQNHVAEQWTTAALRDLGETDDRINSELAEILWH